MAGRGVRMGFGIDLGTQEHHRDRQPDSAHETDDSPSKPEVLL